MKFEWFVATRYFKNNRKDSSFLSFIKIMAIAGVAIGSAGLLIALSVVHGFKSVIEEKIVGFGTHISIETYAGMPIYRADTLITWLEKIPDIRDVEAVVYGQGMIQSGEFVEGTFIKGVGINGDLSDLRNYISQGTYDLGKQGDSSIPGLVMGSRLARNLNATIGSSIYIYAIKGIPSPSNLPEIQQFQVTGIYQTGIDQFDDVLTIIPIENARRLFGLTSPAASQVDIRVSDISKIRSVDNYLYDHIDFPYINLSLYTRYNNIFAWINLQEQTIPLVIGVMIIVAAFNLIGTVLMMVLERVRDIGSMKIIGTENHQIRNIFLIEGFLVGLIGLIIGISIAVLFNWLQATYGFIPLSEENYYMSTAPVEPHLTDFLVVSFITMTLCLLASYIPARVASKLDPLDVTSFGK
jgi:lipoprotein-releasing system permease protein